MKERGEKTISREAAERHEMLASLLRSMHTGIRDLAVKKQEGTLSKARIVMINRLLRDVKDFLKDEPSVPYLQLLDEDSIPQNADALLVVGQYASAMEQFRQRYSSESYEGVLNWRIG